MRIPSEAERAALRARLRADEYRVVLWQDRAQFLALVEPHLSAFWDLRLVEGYSTGLPRRTIFANSVVGSVLSTSCLVSHARRSCKTP